MSDSTPTRAEAINLVSDLPTITELFQRRLEYSVIDLEIQSGNAPPTLWALVHKAIEVVMFVGQLASGASELMRVSEMLIAEVRTGTLAQSGSSPEQARLLSHVGYLEEAVQQLRKPPHRLPKRDA